MKTYFDQNRLVSEADRRFHAADLEGAGGFVQVVPAVVERLAPRVVVGAWSFSERTLKSLQKEKLRDGPSRGEMTGLRIQQWWCRQWRKPNGLYRVKELSVAEKEISESLLGPGGIPPECFPRAEGNLEYDNDANIIAQVITLGGTLLLTSNMVMVDDDRLERWFTKNHNRWPVPVAAHRLVERVDPLYNRWWAEDLGRRVLTETAIAAFWPEDAGADIEVVRQSTLRGLQALARGHFPSFAPKVMESMESDPLTDQRIEKLRTRLPVRMRQAERQRRTMIEGIECFRSEPMSLHPAAGKDPRYDW